MPSLKSCSLTLVMMAALLAGCSATLPERPEDGRHLSAPAPLPAKIPEIVQTIPLSPAPPAAETKLELYSVTVHEAPIRELLFAMARDAALNIDIHPEISGTVTINAIDQTLPQILARIARQANIKWEIDPPNLIIDPDRPVLRTYRIGYVNIARRSSGNVGVATSIATTGAAGDGGGGGGSGGGGGNNSTTTLSQESNNTFWATLIANLGAIIGESGGTADAGTGGGSANIISNPESGVIAVRATTRQHEEIQRFIDLVMTRALHQVLIEATVVEVTLSDRYQAGVDWEVVGRNSGRLSFFQTLTGANLNSPPAAALVIDKSADPDALTATVRLLDQFGDLKVLSSPKLMVLNNQTAMLKVVDNRVHFTIEVESTVSEGVVTRTYETTVHTVPVGFVMAVTPQIGEDEQVTLNVRPTISRIIGYVNDPSPALADAGVVSRIPEIQVREVESILKIGSGQIAILGGLMQDSLDKSSAGLPVLSRLPGVGNLFSYRDDTARKTELIIFLRPLVIRQAGLAGDLGRFRDFLPTSPFPPAASPGRPWSPARPAPANSPGGGG